MAQLDARSEELSRTESVAERADAYKVALTLLKGHDWPEGLMPSDALSLAMFLTEGLNNASADYESEREHESADAGDDEE